MIPMYVSLYNLLKIECDYASLGENYLSINIEATRVELKKVEDALDYCYRIMKSNV